MKSYLKVFILLTGATFLFPTVTFSQSSTASENTSSVVRHNFLELFGISETALDSPEESWVKKLPIATDVYLEISKIAKGMQEKYPYSVSLKMKNFMYNLYFFYLNDNFEIQEFFDLSQAHPAQEYVSCLVKDNRGIHGLARLQHYATNCTKLQLLNLKSAVAEKEKVNKQKRNKTYETIENIDPFSMETTVH